MGAADPIIEARRLLDAATDAGLHLRLTGGVAIATICPSAQRPPLQREYGDIDFVGRSRNCREIELFFSEIGYVAEEDFNALHGQRRLFFNDPEVDREADVFLDGVRACHMLDLRDRLDVCERTVSPADLLLSKLQVVETNEKDFKDIIAIVTDHDLTRDESGVSLARVVQVCSEDWGWWRTVTMVVRRTIDATEQLVADESARHAVRGKLERLLVALDASPKSRRWKLRARVGDRVRWHEEPEELEH